MKRKIIALLVLIISVFSVTASAEYNPFQESRITAVFVGLGRGTDEICGYLSEEFAKSVDKTAISALTSKEMLGSLGEITAKKPDVVFIDIADDDKESAELLIRGILEAKRDTVIVFVAMPKSNGDNSAVLEVAKAYNTGIIDFDEYVNRRITAGVLQKSEILSGDVLNEKGKELFYDCLKFYKTRPYKKAVYLETSLSGKYNAGTEVVTPDVPIVIPEDDGLTKDEAVNILNGAAVVNVYSNTARINGENVLVDVKNPLIKPASFGGGISYPVRFLRDYFDCKVKYNIKAGEITLTGPKNTATVGFYKNTMISEEKQVLITYPVVMYENITYIPEEVLSFVTGKSAFSADGIGVICDGQLTDAEKASVIEYLKEGEI